MWDAFHGASLDAISIGGEAVFRKGMGRCYRVPNTRRRAIHTPACMVRWHLQCALRGLHRVRAGQGGGRGGRHRRDVRCTDVQIPRSSITNGFGPAAIVMEHC